MGTFKKHLEIYKINRQIRSLRSELVNNESGTRHMMIGGGYYTTPQNIAFRSTEKETIIRNSINTLADQREGIRRG